MKEEKDKSVINKDVFVNSHVVRHDYIGETLDAEEFLELQRILNERRPYRPSDFERQYFIPEEFKKAMEDEQ